MTMGFHEIVILSVAPIYVMMTTMVCLTQVSPFLAKLSLHGKVLHAPSPQQQQQQQQSTTRTRQTDKPNQSTSTVSRLHRIIDRLWIPKSYFRYFYLLATANWILIYGLAQRRCFPMSSDPTKHYHIPTTIAIPMFAHCLRRTYECYYIHRWRSNMHIASFLLGIFYYTLLPWAFLQDDSIDATANVISMSLHIYFQYEQYRHHELLSQLRQQNHNAAQYHLPMRQRFFRYVSCPHYLMEVLLYASLIFALPFDSINRRHCGLLLWVCVSLSINALHSQTWYRQTFNSKTVDGDTAEFVSQRKAIIPWIL
mmetsp:Transcript_9865/g.26936  ORF Transcript_9865/g.26936 Transcript_9865/m.26936 type:complete len:310 (-) Transcript_9865:46-975(-)